MKRWYIITPEYDEVDPITEDGYGPVESVRDVVEVQARTKREAKCLAVKVMRKEPKKYQYINYDRSCCPFTGLRVESA